MIQWLSTKEFMDVTGLKYSSSAKVIASKVYKKQPLIIRQQKNSHGGKPRYLVAWNIETNQPATKEESKLLRVVPPVTPLVATDGDTFLVEKEDKTDDFETLLYRFLLKKSLSSRKVLKSRYRKLYKESGSIPAAISGNEKRGRQSQLSPEIKARFIALIENSVDSKHADFHTRDTRKITVLHLSLEKEFSQVISIDALYRIVRQNKKLKNLLEQDDSGVENEKPPSYFKTEKTGDLIQMDGVIADYFSIIDENGKSLIPVFIEFFDTGSRKLLAMHAYKSESSEASVDIFTRFLTNHQFAKKIIKIRPDNAGGFLNLRRPIKELNNKYAKPDGFTFLDNYARAGTPKDKAHLESSHRLFHRFEQQIINHFKDQVIERVLKHKKIGNRLENITITRLNITLKQLNDSGLVAGYMKYSNEKTHRFTENGQQVRWKPDTRWKSYLIENEDNLFRFTDEDVTLCRVYGFNKSKATISKEGTITYQKSRYYVDDKTLWSHHSSTKVVVSLIHKDKDSFLAVFKDDNEGVLLTKAMRLTAPKQSEKGKNQEKNKVIQINQDNSLVTLIEKIQLLCGTTNRDTVISLIDQGATIESIEIIIKQHQDSLSEITSSMVKFNILMGKIKRELPKERVIPFANQA